MSIPFAYFTIVAIWSTTPLAIQWSALGTGFAFAVMARMLIGATLALTLIVVWRIGLPLHRKARQSYLVGGLGMFGAMLSTYWGAQYIHSGLVSVLFGLTPLATSILAAVWLGERALRPAKLIGMALGIIGLTLIFATGHEVSGHQAVLGIAALLLAVFLYSASLVGVKHIGDQSPPLATTTGTLLVALPLFILAWWLVDGRIPSEISATCRRSHRLSRHIRLGARFRALLLRDQAYGRRQGLADYPDHTRHRPDSWQCAERRDDRTPRLARCRPDHARPRPAPVADARLGVSPALRAH